MTLEQRLKEETEAELYFDPVSLQAWSTDASIFRVIPLGIAAPRSQEDLKKIVRIASELSIPLIPRGAATGISGGCLGAGLIVDVSKYLNQILEIDFESETITVEPGVVLDDLNQKLSEKGYRLGPETSTGNRATLGGMAANNASGARSLRYGKMIDHVLETKVILAGGEETLLKELTESEWENKIREDSPLGKIVRSIEHIKENYSEAIKANFPKLDRHVSGYNLDTLLSSTPPNLAKLIVGSEGSLGIIASLKLSLSKKPRTTGLALIHFHSLKEAFIALPELLRWDFLALEILDRHILKLAKKVPHISKGMNWLNGDPEGVIIAEFDTDSLNDTKLKLSSFEADLRHHSIGYAYYLMTEPSEMQAVWDMRKAGLGLLMSKRSYTNAVAFLEDMAVPPEHLASFMEAFLTLLRENNLEAGIYGHIGSGCMHIRPYLNLTDENDLKKVAPLMEKGVFLVLAHQGALSGEHGDGLIRSWLNEKLFGKEVIKAFQVLKQAFDPENLMNPGKIVNPLPFDDLKKILKISPATPLNVVSTYLNFEKEGGFALSTDLCNGNGLCRKKEGVMCPSFQATHDEFNSTRARANVLQGMIHKTKGSINWLDHGVHKVLDLCLECKGCKTECPSSVDMAKMKMEFLYQYNQRAGIPIRSRLLSSFPKLLSYASYFTKAFNWLMEKEWVKNLQSNFGIAAERPFPLLTKERFSVWYSLNVKGKQKKGKQVVLFNDTYNEFLHPEVGISAVKVLNALGYEVIVPPWRCCGRPLLSKGRLKQAQKMGSKLIHTLSPYLKAKIPILGLEPSCLFTLIDEYQDLPNLEAKELLPLCKTFDQFMNEHLIDGKLPLRFKENQTKVKVHGHCHEKALVGIQAALEVLKGVPGFEVEEIPSGCCGMAGSFGYEKEHYDLSMKIGELILLPEVRRSTRETLIVANGFSCRTQIREGAGRSAIHLAEALDRFLDV